MLKGRIKNIEKQVKVGLPQKKELKTWTVIVDENDPEIKEPNKEAQRLINEIKAGKVKHKDGSFYSEEGEHLFVIRIITDKKDFVEELRDA